MSALCDNAISYRQTHEGEMRDQFSSTNSLPDDSLTRRRAQSCIKPSAYQLQPSKHVNKKVQKRFNTLQTSNYTLPLFATQRQRSSTWHGNASVNCSKTPQNYSHLLISKEKRNSLLDDASSSCDSLKGSKDGIDLQNAAECENDTMGKERQIIQDIVCDILYTELLDTEYEESMIARHCAFVVECVQARLRDALPRENVKAIVTAYIGQQQQQNEATENIVASCQCLWEVETDQLVNVNFQNGSMFAICSVFIVEGYSDAT